MPSDRPDPSEFLALAQRMLRGLPLLTYTSGFDMLQEAKWFAPLRASSAVSMTTNSTHAPRTSPAR